MTKIVSPPNRLSFTMNVRCRSTSSLLTSRCLPNNHSTTHKQLVQSLLAYACRFQSKEQASDTGGGVGIRGSIWTRETTSSPSQGLPETEHSSLDLHLFLSHSECNQRATHYARCVSAEKDRRSLESKPCGRCDKDHMTKNCPISRDGGCKGRVWRDIPEVAKGNADDYLSNHKNYVRPASAPPSHAKSAAAAFTKATGHMKNLTLTGPSLTRREYHISDKPVGAYLNTTTNGDMYYPSATQDPLPNPNGNGKPWQLPERMANGNDTSKIHDPLFPLRESYFNDHSKKQVILTNHFEYELNTETFYEYKVLDLGTKNRKRMRQLIDSAMTHWSFLRENINFFATNYVDTIVSWKLLHLGLPDPEHPGEWPQYIPTTDQDPLQVRFKYINSFDADTLREYAFAKPSYASVNFENIARCLNIVISKSFGSQIHKLSTNKFFVKSARGPLSDMKNNVSNQLELIRGYFYSVKPGMGNIILNFNICTSAIFRPISLDEFLYRNNTFPPETLESILRGKTVYLTLDRKDKDPQKEKLLNSEKSRFWKVWEIQSTGNIEDLTFMRPVSPAKTKDGRQVTETVRVIDHLRAVSASGQAPKSGKPAVNVGSRNNPIWYALEHFRLVPYQPYTRKVPDAYTRSMVEQACRDPHVSRALIENEGLSNMGFTAGSTAASFGSNVPVRLTPTMLQVPHQVLPIPVANYSSWDKAGDIVAMQGSHWKFPRKANRFFRNGTRQKLRYAIMVGPNVSDATLKVYEARLRGQFEKLNIFVEDCARIPEVIFKPRLDQITEANIHAKLKILTAANRNIDVVFFLLEKSDVTVYRDFKNAADRIYPIQSICMTRKEPKPPKGKHLSEKQKEDKVDQMISEIITNIMMKVNLKLGGINHCISGVSEWLKNTMVIGADLVHPGGGAFPGTPSIAAVVGSVDPDGGKCLGSLRLQRIDKTDREIIDAFSLEEMVLDRLASWEELHGLKSLPENILYYRDGVSSGHFQKVQEHELKAIEEAYRSARKNRDMPERKLNLTAVVVTKRHHTRFYPQKPEEGDFRGNRNTLPGTCVDQLVTSPYYQDFFLQSHSGIKGTARPTHYFVLENNIPNMSLTALRNLTHNLCYSYVRAMSGVSYASPTYYADRLCERGRLYLRTYYNGDDTTLKAELEEAKKKKLEAQKQARDKIFGSHWRVKSLKEKDMEKEHSAELANHLKDLTYKKVQAAFYNQDPESEPVKEGWNNPYAFSLRNTMFWM